MWVEIDGERVRRSPVDQAHPVRYPGPRWNLVYGAYDGAQKTAVNTLQRALQHHVPYTLRVQSHEDYSRLAGGHYLLAGTTQNNRFIAELVERKAMTAPSGAQGYALACLTSPWDPAHRLVVIAGSDPSGVLYGAQAYLRRGGNCLPQNSHDDFHVVDCPRIEKRGLWSWGYVIYDYRRFLDRMLQMKMNLLVVWNDCPPVNARDVIAYAHDRGIQVVWGFHWGWGTELDLGRLADVATIRETVLQTYEELYRPLQPDGIYFQTLTEHHEKTAGGRALPEVLTAMVNDIAGALLERAPGLQIYFGLHATSIARNLAPLAGLDPRVEILWENAGLLPYTYDPVATAEELTRPGRPAHWRGERPPDGVDTLDRTLSYSMELADVRPANEFAVVAKGWTALDWTDEFEHHDSFILGERDPVFVRERSAKQEARWSLVNVLWAKNHPMARRFYEHMRQHVRAPMTVVGLVEDGAIEEQLPESVALFGEMLWNPCRSDAEILDAARQTVLE